MHQFQSLSVSERDYCEITSKISDIYLDFTNLTEKGKPSKLPWCDIHTEQFENLKTKICKHQYDIARHK